MMSGPIFNDIEGIRAAYEVAQTSPDPSTQIGAVIAKDGYLLTWACNTFPMGIAATPERLERPVKYTWIEHAERNAIAAAACYSTVTTRNATMYCACGVPCAECARMVIQAGIRDVVCHDYDAAMSYKERWGESVQIGEQMLTESGVEIRWLTYKFGVSVRRNGELVEV